MKVGILGSGIVGQTIGAKLADRGVDVVLGTCTPEQLDDKRGMGPPLSEWLAKAGRKGGLGTFADAAAQGDLIINATSGAGSLEALMLAGAEHLEGKILMLGTPMLNFKIARQLRTGEVETRQGRSPSHPGIS